MSSKFSLILLEINRFEASFKVGNKWTFLLTWFCRSRKTRSWRSVKIEQQKLWREMIMIGRRTLLCNKQSLGIENSEFAFDGTLLCSGMHLCEFSGCCLFSDRCMSKMEHSLHGEHWKSDRCERFDSLSTGEKRDPSISYPKYPFTVLFPDVCNSRSNERKYPGRQVQMYAPDLNPRFFINWHYIKNVDDYITALQIRMLIELRPQLRPHARWT